jgi:tRNA pseudouridine55 synthase
VEVPKKKMKFWNVDFLSQEGDRVRIHLHCSKGSYIRTWINEFGLHLGCGATMTQLTRTSSVPFKLDQSLTLNQIEDSLKNKHSLSCFIPLEHALPSAKKIRVKGQDQRLLKNGQISHDLKLKLIQTCNPEIDRLIFVTAIEGEPLALIGFEERVGFSIRRVFHFET